MNKASMKSINQLKEMVENEPECKIDYLRPKQGAEMYNISFGRYNHKSCG